MRDTAGGTKPPKPTLYGSDLANPPAALRPLLERPQWAIWRLTWDGKRWSKPPFMAREPERIASSADPGVWVDYTTAVAAAAKYGDGVTYILSAEDTLAAFDLDHARDPATATVAEWAQRLLNTARHTYAEISPSGTGLRIWGTAVGAPMHRAFNLENGCKLELFRRARKPLTVSMLQLGRCLELGNVDQAIERALLWAERHKAAPTPSSGAGTTIGPGIQLSIQEIEEYVQLTPAPVGGQSIRSELFHVVVGHYHGCGWTVEQIYEHLAQYPDGVGGRYLAEGRLSGEIERSLQRLQEYSRRQQQIGPDRTWTGDWEVRSTPETESEPESEPAPEAEPELELELEPDLEPDVEPVPDLPPMYRHGDPDPRPLKSWLVKRLMSTVGHGLLSGQWGTGKTVETGTRGSSAKEGSADLVLACLGERELSGRVLNTRLAVRKNRGGKQGIEFPFTLREVEHGEPDEDGESTTTLVVDWQHGPGVSQGPPTDPWQQSRQSSLRTTALRLKRILMSILAERGVDQPITPGGLVVRMIDKEIVREEFYAQTPADGTPEQKTELRRKQFSRVLEWAEAQELIGIREIEGLIYFWLSRPEPPHEEI